MNARSGKQVWVLMFAALVGASAEAHSRFNPAGNIPGRSTASNGKVGPCDGVARTGTAKVLASGSQVRVDWQETIQHPGYYEIYFSAAGDANFVKIATIQDTQNLSNDLPHNFSTTVTLPTGTCTDCTLQLVQVMTENNPPTMYYSCADIELANVAPPAPTPVPTPVPTPGPAPSPHSCN